jgi:hypothetical protein
MKPPRTEETWTAVASLDDLREGDLAEVSAGADVILLAYLPGGEVRAYQGISRVRSSVNGLPVEFVGGDQPPQRVAAGHAGRGSGCCRDAVPAVGDTPIAAASAR